MHAPPVVDVYIYLSFEYHRVLEGDEIPIIWKKEHFQYALWNLNTS